MKNAIVAYHPARGEVREFLRIEEIRQERLGARAGSLCGRIFDRAKDKLIDPSVDLELIFVDQPPRPLPPSDAELQKPSANRIFNTTAATLKCTGVLGLCIFLLHVWKP